MNTSLMLNAYQTPVQAQTIETANQAAAPWTWELPAQQATTLAASDAPRWLHVESGCVWLTQVGAVEQADDIWLRAGQSLALPAGTAWVVEGWPQAGVSLLLQPPAVSAVRRGRELSSTRRGWWRALAS